MQDLIYRNEYLHSNYSGIIMELTFFLYEVKMENNRRILRKVCDYNNLHCTRLFFVSEVGIENELAKGKTRCKDIF